MPDDNATDPGALVPLTADIVSAFVSRNRVGTDELPALIASIFAAFSDIQEPKSEDAPLFTPAVTARKSLASADTIISMIDGKSYSSLKRHLATNGLTPNEYRRRYNLPSSYPMIAPGYSEQRRAIATKVGLGRKKVDGAIEAAADAVAEELEPGAPTAATDAASKPKRGRKPKAVEPPLADTVAPEAPGEEPSEEAAEPTASGSSVDEPLGEGGAEPVDAAAAKPRRGRPRKVKPEEDGAADAPGEAAED